MPSDQLLSKRYNRDTQLQRGIASQLTPKSGGVLVGEAFGSIAVTGLSTATYTDDVKVTFLGNPNTHPTAAVVNQALGIADVLVIPTYTDQGDVTAAWTIPGTVIENCEDSWDGSSWQATGVSGVASTTNAIVGTNAVQFQIDGTSAATDFGFEATGTLDLSTMTYIAFWLTTDVALDAGDVSVGISTVNTFATDRTLAVLPAQAVGTTLHILALAGNAAVESVGLVLNVDPGDGNLYIDDVRSLTDTEQADTVANRIPALTAQDVAEPMNLNTGDRMANLTDVAVRGGTNGDDLEIRGM